ncbi:hypothetical protein DERP_001613 [Dermatophagoides pteronyssinus]|uniref:Uncharacterized protein n=1 Tax=Dermatophagoides pteronyssinus TaxID=6956 RepID=A0ABQ8JB00_DERPT|nr:hypothetical protein DERP_001613 [Dermatophagoides pteronyssinus]
MAANTLKIRLLNDDDGGGGGSVDDDVGENPTRKDIRKINIQGHAESNMFNNTGIWWAKKK